MGANRDWDDAVQGEVVPALREKTTQRAQPKAERIKYKKGYRKQLAEMYATKVAIYPVVPIASEYIYLQTNGLILINRGYAWDGATGVPDTKKILRGSLVHDALYQLMREGELPRTWRKTADRELARMCREDGMTRLGAAAVYRAVQMFAGRAVKKRNQRQVLVSP